MTNRFWLPALLLVVCAHNGRSDGGVARVRKVRTWQTATPLIGLAWSPDGQKIATASDFGRTLAVWTVDGKREAEFARHLNNGSYLHNSLAFLDGGKLLLTPPEAGTEKRALSIWDIAQGKVIRDVPGPFPAKHFRFNEAQFFAVSTDGSVVAVVSSVVLSEPVTVYSTRTWSVVDRIAMDAGPSKPSTATAIAFSPDGKRLAIGQLDGTIKIHGVGGTNSEMATVAAYDPRMLARIESLSFSPDGKYLVSGLGLVLDAYKSLPAVKLWRLGDLSMVGAYLPGCNACAGNFLESRRQFRGACGWRFDRANWVPCGA